MKIETKNISKKRMKVLHQTTFIRRKRRKRFFTRFNSAAAVLLSSLWAADALVTLHLGRKKHLEKYSKVSFEISLEWENCLNLSGEDSRGDSKND